MVLMTIDCAALFVWQYSLTERAGGYKGVMCSIFRNEGTYLSSTLIIEAMALAWERWPGERLFTFVNAKKIASVNPGYCFKKAGWKHCGYSKARNLVILEAMP
jgi:hypothetical protein